MSERVVITGIGAVTPVGNDRESTWRALLEGRSGVGPITAFDPGDLPTRIAAEVKGFDPTTVVTGKRLRRSARFTQLAIAAAREAVADAGLKIAVRPDVYPNADDSRNKSTGSSADTSPDANAGSIADTNASPDASSDASAGPRRDTNPSTSSDAGSWSDANRTGDGFGVDPDRVGVVINAAVAGFDTIEGATRQLVRAGLSARLNPYFVASSLTNMPACEVAIDLGVHGPVTASALACASGVYALVEARRLILSGEADVVVCGGTDAAISASIIAGLSTIGALSRYNDDPERASRPFDAERDGFVFGEGSVVMILESASHAARRGARAYAALAGGALTADAFHVSAPAPDGRYAAAAISRALTNSGMRPEQIDYVCAHGTSTRANDRTETMAIRAAFGRYADDVAVSSPKSMVGHLIGAAGALGAMVAILAIRDGIVPPTTNLTTPDPECDLDYVPNVARRMPVRVAAANAFGFGGQNCVAIFTEAEAEK